MKIKFLPQNLVVEGNPDKTLLKIATENHLEIRSICKGVPSCAECRVKIVEGEANVLPPSKAELSLIGSSYFIDGRRLSCQVRCFGDVTIDLAEQVDRSENQVKKIRGFRSNRQVESKAVNDTMLLNEKTEHHPEHKSEPGAEPQQAGQPRQQPQQRAQQPRPQQTQQNQKNNRDNRNNRNNRNNKDRK